MLSDGQPLEVVRGRVSEVRACLAFQQFQCVTFVRWLVRLLSGGPARVADSPSLWLELVGLGTLTSEDLVPFGAVFNECGQSRPGINRVSGRDVGHDA
jgi:hypothetical protein